ncbi:hypothetical protein SNE40_008202 [Patella caerulea]|uniref:SUEL-type lectin domain-containing protein n=1 Tax=Patella caerulea TaxID=87958 RepID=A0AAN8JZM1_PATCE
MDLSFVICSLFLVSALHGSYSQDVRCGLLVQLQSNNQQYNRTYVTDVAAVHSISVHRQLSYAPCTHGQTFGSRGASIYVDKGCGAVFSLCYIDGDLKTGECRSYVQPQTCRYSSKDKIVSVEILRPLSQIPCVHNKNLFVSGPFLTVHRGCAAEFLVGVDS